MKTQILRLDPHDDVNSTRDKMNWGQTGRILLVWPEHGRLLRRRVDLVLLQRQSYSLGAQLALVTNDPVVRFHAHQLAIPIFKNLRQAQSAHWRVERRRRVRPSTKILRRSPPRDDLEALRQAAHQPSPAWLAKPAARVGFFTLGVLAMLALAAVLLPGAKVSLTPQTRNQSLTLTLRADPAQENINLSGIVPAQTVTAIVEGRDQLEASGRTFVPDRTSTGEVIFTNLSDQPINIPVGLVVRAMADPPVRFTTLQNAELAAGPGITTTLSVRALTPGETGNLPPGMLTAIEGNLGLALTATNPTSTHGGTDRSVPMPTPLDQQRLYEKLESALRKSAQADIEAQLSPGDLLFTQTLTITRILEETYIPSDGLPSGQIELSLRLEYQSLSAKKSDLDTLATVLLDANLPRGYIPQPNTLAMEQVAPPAIEGTNIVHWQFNAQRSLKADIKPSQAVNLILGLPPVQATERLSAALPLSSKPVIKLTPGWWPRLPIIPFRIAIDENPGR